MTQQTPVEPLPASDLFCLGVAVDHDVYSMGTVNLSRVADSCCVLRPASVEPEITVMMPPFAVPEISEVFEMVTATSNSTGNRGLLYESLGPLNDTSCATLGPIGDGTPCLVVSSCALFTPWWIARSDSFTNSLKFINETQSVYC